MRVRTPNNSPAALRRKKEKKKPTHAVYSYLLQVPTGQVPVSLTKLEWQSEPCQQFSVAIYVKTLAFT